MFSRQPSSAALPHFEGYLAEPLIRWTVEYTRLRGLLRIGYQDGESPEHWIADHQVVLTRPGVGTNPTSDSRHERVFSGLSMCAAQDSAPIVARP